VLAPEMIPQDHPNEGSVRQATAPQAPAAARLFGWTGRVYMATGFLVDTAG